jgi:hypothetical protein
MAPLIPSLLLLSIGAHHAPAQPVALTPRLLLLHLVRPWLDLSGRDEAPGWAVGSGLDAGMAG